MSSLSLVSPLLAESQSLVDPSYRAILLLGAVALSVAIAYQWSRSMRMSDYYWKLALVLGSMTWGVVGTIVYWPPKLGIDLSGGVILVYELERPQINLDEVQQKLEEQLKEKVKDIGDFTIQKNATENLLTIEAAKADKDLLDAIKTSSKAVSLRGQELEDATASGPHAARTVAFHVVPSKAVAVDMDNMVGQISRRVNPTGTKEITIRKYGKDQMEIIIPEVDKNEVERIKRDISTAGNLEFRIAASPNYDGDIIALAEKTRGDRVERGGEEVARWVPLDPAFTHRSGLYTREKGTDDKGKAIVEALLLIDKLNITSQIEGGLIDRASKGFGDRLNSWAVHFSFKPLAASRFFQITSQNVVDRNTGATPRQLSIVLDNHLMSAPSIQSAISDQGQITGDFTEEDVQWLVNVLNAGSLPAALNKTPISQQQISAQLGADTVRKGAWAMAFSVIAILVFMIAYYRLAGFIACWAMLVNLALTVYLMIVIQAAFTLPGLAGLVLGVAMCVDANVLIYERIREERERGAALKMAIRNGFHRSTPTIVDSHVTTLITAVVLYVVGTEQIRGFAVTLILGLLLNMYTALFCSHVIFDVGERRNWFKDLRMHHLFGHTTIDFMQLQRLCIPMSIVLILAGIIGAYVRGKDLLDIDFTGGSSVQVVFKDTEAMDIAKVRTRLEENKILPNVSVSNVQIEGQAPNRHYKIDTAEQDIKVVKEKLSTDNAFAKELQHYDMQVKSIKPIAGGDKSDKPDKPGKASDDKPAKTENTNKKEKPTGKQSRHDNAAAAKLALHLGSPLQLLAYDGDKDDAKSEEKKAEATKTDDKAADDKKPEDKKPDDKSPEDKKPEDKSSEDKKPEDKTPSDLSPRPKTDPIEVPKPQAGKAAAKSDGTDEDKALAGGTEAELFFPEEINYDVLKEFVISATAALKLSEPPAYRIEDPNKEFKAGSKKTYAKWILKISLPQDKTDELLKTLRANLNQEPVFLSATNIGGKVAGDTQEHAISAVLISMFFIVIYIWIRFQNVVFGLGAVVALVHDVIIPVGIMAWCAWIAKIYVFEHFLGIDPFQISLPVMAAILTLMGYSLNDTIVVFDRIREVRGKSPTITAETVNVSINQTLSRTVLTSWTVFLVVLILYIWGGQGVHAFSFAMLIGVVTGTYSSIYIAAPILVRMFKTEPVSAKALAAAAREKSAKVS